MSSAGVAGYRTENHQSWYAQRGLFGLSAGEVPAPWRVAPPQIYQPYGVGGVIPANDGSALHGAPVIVPYASAVLAGVSPTPSLRVWTWLIANGFFSPLNNVESLMYDPSDPRRPPEFNSLRGSLNLALQTLGFGRYLTRTANPLHHAVSDNPFLKQAYRTLALRPRL